jgi:superfamily II DNA or RNA helicase
MRLKAFLNELGYPITIKYLYTPPPAFMKKNINPQLYKMKPRKYQMEAAWIAVNQRRGVIKLPTGAGKTVVSVIIIRTIGKRTLFLTHKKDIFHQTYDRFVKEFGKNRVGRIGDGIKEYDREITIGMVQTLVKLGSKNKKRVLAPVDVFIGDEIHHAGAKTWARTIAQCKAMYRLGLTATPFDGPKAMSLEAATGPVIYTAPVHKLAAKGYLSLPEIVMTRLTKPEINPRFDYHQAFRAGIIENSRRNKRIIAICQRLVKNRRGPVLVFSTTLDHLESLMEMAAEKRMNFNILTGADSSKERTRVTNQMKRGKLDVLFVSTIFDEGVDIPNVGSIVMAAVGKNKNKLIQRLGRGMRVAKNKNKFLVVDFWDDTCKYLLAHSTRRKNIYKKEGYAVTVGSLVKWLEDQHNK